jgi:hypothetical protein
MPPAAISTSPRTWVNAYEYDIKTGKRAKRKSRIDDAPSATRVRRQPVGAR